MYTGKNLRQSLIRLTMKDMIGYYFNKLACTAYSGLNNIYTLSAMGKIKCLVSWLIFVGSDRSSRSHSVFVGSSVCKAQSCQEHAIFIFQPQILYHDSEGIKPTFGEHSEGNQRILKEHSEITRESNQTLSYRRSLKYIVLFPCNSQQCLCPYVGILPYSVQKNSRWLHLRPPVYLPFGSHVYQHKSLALPDKCSSEAIQHQNHQK